MSAKSLDGALRLYVTLISVGYKLVQYAFLAALASSCNMFAQSSSVVSSFITYFCFFSFVHFSFVLSTSLFYAFF
jgi:hypothetical protein